jgi:hypothetical protein
MQNRQKPPLITNNEPEAESANNEGSNATKQAETAIKN